jgi:acetylornithine deacetylase/succinyl-diaminopimelate desuccinylase-like protein
MRAIVKIAREKSPGVPVVPLLLTGTTDSSVFRRLGIVSYGFEPYALTDAEQATQHGANERISVENLKLGLEFTHRVVAELVY